MPGVQIPIHALFLKVVFLSVWFCLLGHGIVLGQERNATLGGEGYRENQYPGVSESASKIFFSDKKFAFSGYLELNQIFPTVGQIDRSSQELELYYSDLYRFSPFFGFRLSKSMMLTAEFQVEYLRDNNLEDEIHVNPELYVDYLINKKVNVRAGIFPLNMGYINNNEEPILFYSVNRPDVERLIIPTGWNELGIGLYGAITSDLHYFVSFTNGVRGREFRSPTWIRAGSAPQLSVNTIAINPQINYTGFSNLTLSLSGYWANAGQNDQLMVAPDMSADVQSNVGMVSGYARWDYKQLRLIGMGVYGTLSGTEDLYALTLQKQQTAQVLGAAVYGMYAEAGLDILPFFLRTAEQRTRFNEAKHRVFRRSHAMLPIFARLERFNTHHQISSNLPQDQAVIQDVFSLTFGFNYEPNEQMAIKIDYVIGDNRYGAHKELIEFGLGVSF